MIEMSHLQKSYQDFQLDCTMQVKSGMITGLAGRNGAGKSTTFKAILGLIRPDAGDVRVLGKPAEKLAPSDREQMGVVLSDSGTNEYLTLEDTIAVQKKLYRAFDEVGFRERCKKFQLPYRKKIKDFSTGMKRKLQINLAISHGAKLLIMDEPTAGLDVSSREMILDLLREYVEDGEKSILISSHIATDLEPFCDDIYLIDQGRIVLHEDTDVLLDQYGVLKVTKEQFAQMDQDYIIAKKEEEYGYRCLTNEKQFYLENYPELIIEKSGIDELILMDRTGEEGVICRH